MSALHIGGNIGKCPKYLKINALDIEKGHEKSLGHLPKIEALGWLPLVTTLGTTPPTPISLSTNLSISLFSLLVPTVPRVPTVLSKSFFFVF